MKCVVKTDSTKRWVTTVYTIYSSYSVFMYWICRSIFCDLIGKFLTSLQFKVVVTLVLLCNKIELIFYLQDRNFTNKLVETTVNLDIYAKALVLPTFSSLV